MKINHIELENFKCFESLKIDTSDLTLITGANSSGKSTILYSILGALQSDDFPLQYSLNGKYVIMGDYQDIVASHDTEKDIKFAFNYTANDIQHDVETLWEEDKTRKLALLKYLSINTDFFSLQIVKRYKYHLEFKYEIEKDPFKDLSSPEMVNRIIASVRTITKQYFKEKSIAKIDKDKQENLNDYLTKYANPKKTVRLSANTIEELKDQFKKEDSNYYLDHFLGKTIHFFKSFSDKSNFISSFRLLPEKTYYETSKVDLKIGKYGESYVDQIILWELRNSKKIIELKEVIRELGLVYDIKTVRIGGGRYELLIKVNKNGVWASVTNVGFGISQFLPIIVADLQLNEGSTLFIAQPEIHLHPSIQATFANYLINSIKNKKKNYVIETHSEYLINRLRLEIVKENIDSKNIKTYFIDNKRNVSKSYQINFLKNGQIKGAPKSFFDTYMVDTMNITLEAM